LNSKDNTDNSSVFNSIAKSTWTIGSSQFITLIIGVAKTKLTAIFLGNIGMGVFSILSSLLTLFGSIINLGISTSAIKEVASLSKDDNHNLSYTLNGIKKVIVILGIIGSMAMIVFSSLLSSMIFGDKNYSFSIILLSIALFFNQITHIGIIQLRGLRKLKSLARANVSGAFLGFIISIPMYYFWRIDAIVPVLIVSSLLTYARSKYYVKDITIEKTDITIKESFNRSSKMIKTGIALSISSILTLASSFFIRMFIKEEGGFKDVGLYHAGFLILNNYFGIVFTVLSTDFFPRLSSLINNSKESKKLIENQLIFGLSILSPIICALIIFNTFFIRVLFSSKFQLISEMLTWAFLGIYFKLIGWINSYIILCHDNVRLYTISEIFGITTQLILSILCYYNFGLSGLGIAYLLSFMIYLIQTSFLVRKIHKFQINKSTWTLFFIHLILGVACFIVSSKLKLNLFVSLIPMLMSILLSLHETSKHGLWKKILSKLLIK
jgi:O-antigen/teichoic acid export membrane protein